MHLSLDINVYIRKTKFNFAYVLIIIFIEARTYFRPQTLILWFSVPNIKKKNLINLI